MGHPVNQARIAVTEAPWSLTYHTILRIDDIEKFNPFNHGKQPLSPVKKRIFAADRKGDPVSDSNALTQQPQFDSRFADTVHNPVVQAQIGGSTHSRTDCNTKIADIERAEPSHLEHRCAIGKTAEAALR